jgi:hypothetical protein
MWQFFNTLLQPLYKLFDWLKQFVIGWFGWILGIVAFLLIPLNYILDLFISWLTFLNTRLTQATEYIMEIWDYLGDTYSGVATTLSIANSLFPLGTLFSILTLLFFLWIIGLIYRLVKSYIPTLS